MNAMLRVVSLVALVAATVAGVYIPEFSEETLEVLNLMDPTQRFTVKLTNPDGKAQLKTADARHEFQAIFKVDYENESNSIAKIELKPNDGENVVYDFLFLTVSVDEEEGREVSTLLILIGLEHEDGENVSSIIPVFTTPSSLVEEEKNNLLSYQSWAAENRVGLFPPVVKDAWEIALQTGKLEFDYHWLKELLSFGVYRSAIPTMPNPVKKDKVIPVYVTRPLVVSEHTKNVLVEIANKFCLHEAAMEH